MTQKGTASSTSGNGALRKILEDACKTLRVPQKALTVLGRRDPYRLDTDINHQNGRWLAEQLTRYYGPVKKAHWRGLFYSIIMAKTKVAKPDGTLFSNTDDDWVWLSEKAGKAARWLGYIPFDRIIDQRSDAPIIHRVVRIEPYATIRDDLDDVTFPDSVDPAPAAAGFVARQAFSFALFGEKSSLEEICLPWAVEHQVDLYLGSGEISDTHIFQIARDAIADGRPLVVFAATDCDPSGWQMLISIARKLQAVQDLLFPTLQCEIVHVGITPEHVREFKLAEQPIKKGDKRARAWKDAFGVDQTEIDALTTPEMVERGILRRLLDEAIAPCIDPSLDRRIERAKRKWFRDARAAVDAQIDERALARLRQKIERLHQQIERAKNDLQGMTKDIHLPDVVVPEPDLDTGSLDDARQAVIRFDTDWVEATKILIGRKRYLDLDDEDEDE
jgi:hypothetical protein